MVDPIAEDSTLDLDMGESPINNSSQTDPVCQAKLKSNTEVLHMLTLA